MFYNGNARLEPGAVVCRVARSFIRFGTFQLPASRGEDQAPMVRQLADYVIRHFYPECDPDSPGFKRTVIAQGGEGTSNGANTEGENGGAAANGAASVSGPNKYAEFLAAVARRTGFLVSEWNRVGFVHGVLNTDNMSILGDTIGECGALIEHIPCCMLLFQHWTRLAWSIAQILSC